MPRAEKTSPSGSSDDEKPYSRPSSSPSSSPKKKAAGAGPGAGGKGSAWTPQQKVALFEVAITKGASAKNFEGVIDGKTGHVCYSTWKNTLIPALKRSLGA